MVPDTETLSTIGPQQPVDPKLPHDESLVHMFRRAVDEYPDVTAIVSGETRISYREFGRAVAGLASRLRGLGVGNRRVVLLMPNSVEMDVALMAVMAAGGQVAPANPFFKVRELIALLPPLDPAAIIAAPEMEEKAREVAETLGIGQCLTLGASDPDLAAWLGDPALDNPSDPLPASGDPALVIFTGGSTGVPKGVDLTHGGLVWSLLQHVTAWPLDFGREVFLNAAPMFHIWGLAYGTWVPVYSGSTLIMFGKFEADAVARALGEHGVTVFAGGPAPVYMALLGAPSFNQLDVSSLKYCPTGGAPCPEDLHREWMERVGSPLLEGWGMSEGAPFCLNTAEGERRAMSVGHPVPETRVQIVDLDQGMRILPIGEAGEVRVRGPQIMTGYVSNPEETALALRDGWLYTGDIGYVDTDGFLFLVDRKKDMVIVGGYNVYPREVDEVLFSHPKIREAATVGRPDRLLGEVMVAFVALDSGVTMSPEEFFDFCSGAMVKYKRPVEVYFVEGLPRTGANKIDRRALRQRMREGAGGPDAAP